MSIRFHNKDVILYKKGNALGLDRKEVETSDSLSSFYQSSHSSSDLEKLVINPSEIFQGILAKCDTMEKHILENIEKYSNGTTIGIRNR